MVSALSRAACVRRPAALSRGCVVAAVAVLIVLLAVVAGGGGRGRNALPSVRYAPWLSSHAPLWRWGVVGPAPAHPGTPPEFVHVTAFEQRVSRALGLSPEATIECVGARVTRSWTVDDFVAAVGEPHRFAASRAARAARAASTPQGLQWMEFVPSFSPCDGATRHGDVKDGGKWLCGAETLVAPCAIFSLGSYGQIDFEAAMSADTPCDIFTFDCFNPPAVGTVFPPRVSFEPTCLGEDGSNAAFASLSTLERRHGLVSVAVLKMDVEGAEWDLFDSFYASAVSDWPASFAELPAQISVETHQHKLGGATHNASFARWDRAWQGLLDAGYAVVSSEVNPYCPHCAEYLLVRVPRACWAEPPIGVGLA